MTDTGIEFLVGGGIVAGCWNQIRQFAGRLRSLFIVKTIITNDAAKAARSYCWENFRRSPFGDRVFRSNAIFVRPKGRMQEVAYEVPPGQPLLFWHGWIPLMMGSSELTGNGFASGAQDDSSLILTTLRGTINPEALLIRALDAYNAKKGGRNGNRYRVNRAAGMRMDIKNRTHGYPGNQPQAPEACAQNDPAQSGYRFLSWTIEELGPENPKNPMENLAFSPEMNAVIEKFNRWLKSEDWYRSHGVPWRYGIGFLGAAGSGKTATIRALAQANDMPIYSFDLSSLSNDDMVRAWRDMMESAPCIALFEDLDTVFDGRTNKLGIQGGGLTFDCLLNCIGGIETCDGVCTVVTTNHPESLDHALGQLQDDGQSSRPGRLDTLILMPDLSFDCRMKIANRILADWPEEVLEMVNNGDGQTAAQFTHTACQRALALYWQEPVKAPQIHVNGKRNNAYSCIP